MKKVLQISNYYYPNIGGIEQVARDISNVLRNEDNYEIKVICFNENSSDGNHVCHRKDTIHEMIDGVEIIKCGCITKVASQSISFSFKKELDRVMNEFKPDIVIFHYPNPFEAHYLLRYSKCKFKLLLYWHLDITKQKYLKKLFYRQNIKLINRANYVLGATPMHINTSEFSSFFIKKKKLLPYMIDTSKLVLSTEENEEAKRIKQKYNGYVLGFFVGRHIPYKGLEYLIRASKELNDVPLKIFIAGSGELTNSLKLLAKGDTKIRFVGRISDAQKRAYYKACDIICFPSITRNEGFGLALAEGMYFGKPAVTFKIKGSGVNFVNLADKTGIECPNCDVHAYANAIRKLALCKDLRIKMGNAAKQRVEKNFTPDCFKTNLLCLLNDL